MDSFDVCARLLLAALFFTAALGKLLDRGGALRTLSEFAVPGRLTGVAVFALPAAELLVTIALILAPSARSGAIAGLLLLAAFLIAMIAALSRGHHPDCHCFGAFHSEPVAGATIARNGVLLGIAAAVASRSSHPAIDQWFSQRTGPHVAIVVAVAAGMLSAAYVISLRGKTQKPDAGAGSSDRTSLRVGTQAPRFTAEAIDRGAISLRSLLSPARPVVLVFVQPGCGSCRAMMSDFARWQASLARDLRIVIVSSGDREENRELAQQQHLSDLLLQRNAEVASQYAVNANPAAVVVSSDGTLATTPAIGAAAVEALIRLTLEKQDRTRNTTRA